MKTNKNKPKSKDFCRPVSVGVFSRGFERVERDDWRNPEEISKRFGTDDKIT